MFTDDWDSLDNCAGLYILDENKKPVECKSLKKWSEFMGKGENKRVAETTINGKCYVSTVFLGVDQGFGLSIEGKPLVFETMVFGGFLDQEMMRYHAYEDALKGHDAMVVLTDE